MSKKDVNWLKTDKFYDWNTVMKDLKQKRLKEKSENDEEKFKCRICGCTKYKGVYGDSSLVPLGGTMHAFAYQCCGCSIIFKDIKKFSLEDSIK